MPNALMSMNPTLNVGAGIDIGNAFLTAESIKGQQIKNELYRRQLDNIGGEQQKLATEKLEFIHKGLPGVSFEEKDAWGDWVTRSPAEGGMGMNPVLVSFVKTATTPEDWENKKIAALGKGMELLTYNKALIDGSKINIYKDLDNGTHEALKVTPQEYVSGKYEEKGYKIGELKGTETKPQYVHTTVRGPGGQTKIVSFKQGEQFTPEPGWSLDKPEKQETDMVTLYGPEGATKRIAVPKGTTYTPEEGWSLATPSTKETPEEKRLNSIKTNFFSTIAKANNIKAGVGILPEMAPNKDKIADQEYDRARLLAQEYIAAGGNAADLGITMPAANPEPVLKKLDPATAKQILTQAGGDKVKARLIAKQQGYEF